MWWRGNPSKHPTIIIHIMVYIVRNSHVIGGPMADNNNNNNNNTQIAVIALMPSSTHPH